MGRFSNGAPCSFTMKLNSKHEDVMINLANHVHSSHAEQRTMGKRLRGKCPRSLHATWKAPADRPDPVSLVEASDKGRVPELIPIRHGRMLRSPFTFYRGGALNMAADLANTPVTGLRVQACGDAHLSNFGDFATPERRIIFDINDLDETLPAPWEWDSSGWRRALCLPRAAMASARALGGTPRWHVCARSVVRAH